MGIRIIRESTLQKMQKEAYEQGLNIRTDLDRHYRRIEERNRGLILKGYDMRKAVDEILKRTGF